ncbi:MAG: cyclic nucleotide-binding/CBS domain-containing protein [Candidatus Aenigmatarchaeota archaeon]
MIEEDLDTPLVREVMSEDLNYASREDSVCDIAKTLKKGKRGSVIIKDDGEVEGIITNSDVVNKFVVGDRGNKAKEIMTEDMVTISPNMDIEDAARVMVKEGIERLVVMEGDELLGIISQHDIMQVRPNLYLDISQGIKLGPESAEMSIEEKEVGQCESCENYSEDLEEVNGNLLCPQCQEDMSFA